MWIVLLWTFTFSIEYILLIPNIHPENFGSATVLNLIGQFFSQLVQCCNSEKNVSFLQYGQNDSELVHMEASELQTEAFDMVNRIPRVYLSGPSVKILMLPGLPSPCKYSALDSTSGLIFPRISFLLSIFHALLAGMLRRISPCKLFI